MTAITAGGEQAAASTPAPAGVSPRTIVGAFLRQAERLEGGVFLHHSTDGGWKTITWAEARAKILAIAAALVDVGVRPGDAVILLSENRWEWLCCDLGIQAAGAVTVPIYPSTQSRVVRHIADDSQAVLAIVSSGSQAEKLQLTDRLQRIVPIDPEVTGWIASAPAASATGELSHRLAGLDGSQVASIVYTSGTTGDPKGVVLTHESFVAMTESVLAVYDLSPSDSELSYLPYAHVLERTSGLTTAIAAGAEIWVSRGVDRLIDDIREARPTVMLGVPRVFEKVVKAVQDQVRQQSPLKQAIFRRAIDAGKSRIPGRGGSPVAAARLFLAERLVLASLRNRLTGGRLRFFISGGAPLLKEVEEFFWCVGVPVYQGWGLTETNSGACANTEADHRFGSVGKPFPGVEVRVAADGELLVESPGNMSGYHGQPDATAEAFNDGWLQTGDIGRIDEDGYVWITDRKKDLIKTSGGKYVAPQALEAKLQGHRHIQSVMVVGDGRPYVTALIVPDWAALIRDEALDQEPEELIGHPRVRELIQVKVDELNGELASFETVKYFRLLVRDFAEAEGELTPTLKTRRKIIQQRYQELIDSMYQTRQ
jgi:long-chain acyl-CoA synthetase